MRYSEVLNKIIRIKVYNALSKGECMHNYKFDDDVVEKVLTTYNTNKSKDDVKKLVKDILKVKDTFSTADIPDYVEPNFERLPEVNKSTEEIKKEAEASLTGYKNDAINLIENNYKSGVDKIKTEKETLNREISKNKDSLKDYFNKSRENVKDNSINKGVSRSSIVINQLDAFDKEELGVYQSLDKELQENIGALDFELNSLNIQKEQALENFDIAYAVKLSDKITKLNEELLEEQNKVLKYNNEIAEKEKKYLDDYNKLVSDIQNKNVDKDVKIMDLISKYGKKALDTYKKNKLYEVMDNYFAQVGASEVVEFINNNPELQQALGDDLQDILDRYK